MGARPTDIQFYSKRHNIVIMKLYKLNYKLQYLYINKLQEKEIVT